MASRIIRFVGEMLSCLGITTAMNQIGKFVFCARYLSCAILTSSNIFSIESCKSLAHNFQNFHSGR